MKKTSLLKMVTIIILFFQTMNAGWVREYGGTESSYGLWVELTADGNYILTGSGETVIDSKIFHYLYLIKTNLEGETLWMRTYGDDVKWMGGRCVQQTSDGGYVVAGEVNASPALIRIDSVGDTLWTHVVGEGKGDGHCIRVVDSDYVLTGRGSKDLFLTKVDSEGNTIWIKYYGDPAPSRDDEGHDLQVTSDSGFIVTGYGPEYGLWILRTDSDGDTLWTRLYYLGDQEVGDRGYCIEPTSDGGWIITGGFDYNGISKGILLLMKIDSSGDSLWTKAYDNGNFVEVGHSVRQTPDGGYIVVGSKGYSAAGTGEIWLLKTDPLGEIEWTRTYGGNPQDRADCIQLTSDGGYIITGFTISYSSNGSIQLLLMKTDSLGLVEGIEEPVTPVTPVTYWQITQPVGHHITLKFSDCPYGFRAEIYNASGRKVDEIRTVQSSGTVIWGEGYSPGVYFIREVSSPASAQKVVLTP